MKLPKYDGNIHPDEWLRQIRLYCFLKKTVKENDILKIARMMVDPSIDILENVTSLDELSVINLLRYFLKKSSKRKL